MAGINTFVVIFGFVILQTIIINAEEDLQARLIQLESYCKSSTQSLLEEQSQLGKRLQLDEKKILRLEKEIASSKQHHQYDFPERKRSHALDSAGKLHSHDSPSIVSHKERHSRSADPDEVAFTARLSQVLNNVPLHTTIKFDTRISFTGHNYDETTGVFTCPTSGLYLFAVFIETHSVDKEATVSLKMDGRSYMAVVSERSDAGEDDTGGNVALLPVLKGQRVWVETYGTDNQSFWPGFTTFSGVLIHRH